MGWIVFCVNLSVLISVYVSVSGSVNTPQEGFFIIIKYAFVLVFEIIWQTDMTWQNNYMDVAALTGKCKARVCEVCHSATFPFFRLNRTTL